MKFLKYFQHIVGFITLIVTLLPAAVVRGMYVGVLTAWDVLEQSSL